MIKKGLLLQEARGTIIDIAASVLWSIGLTVFAIPNKVAMGGISGIAQMINYLWGFPVGSLSLLVNVPLLLLAWCILGRRSVLQTLRTLIVYTIVVDFFFASPPIYAGGDRLLAAVFGGALTFMHGSTGGGTDIVVKVVQKKRPYFSTGQLAVVINSSIMLVASLVYGDIEAALYGLIMAFTAGKVVDLLLYGADVGKSCTIVTHKPQEIAQRIIDEMHRSATILEGMGAYLKDNTWVLMCVVRKQEFYNLKRIIRETDHGAFVIVSEAHQILGAGFKSIDESDS
ncbi:MAG: YitT family protein [Oscillospiraceae bacterium]